MYESIKRTLDLLDSKISSDDLLEGARHSRFLRECKQRRGFPEAIQSGMLKQGPKAKVAHNKRGPVSDERRAEVHAKVLEVNKRRVAGMSRRSACREVQIGEQMYADWANRLNIKREHLCKKRGPAKTVNLAHMREKVQAINNMRLDGIDARQAAADMGVPYDTYYSWAVDLNMRIKTLSPKK